MQISSTSSVLLACSVIHLCAMFLHVRKNHKLDHIVERTALPDELIRGASGKLAFEDQQPRVSHCCIIHYYDRSGINCHMQLLSESKTFWVWITWNTCSMKHWFIEHVFHLILLETLTPFRLWLAVWLVSWQSCGSICCWSPWYSVMVHVTCNMHGLCL